MAASLTTASAMEPSGTDRDSLTVSPPSHRETQGDDFSLADELSLAFESVAETIRPSVVSVSAVKKVQTTQLRPIPHHGPLGNLFQFFHQAPGQNQVQEGYGTGFVIDGRGYILTNNHVVGGADEVRVRTWDDRTIEAEVVGSDPKTDLAVLRVEDDSLPPVRMGDSDALRVGQWVVAAGTPFGLSSTITSGIVSAKGRSRMGIADYEDFIQTDAAINPGNSGGPLVNLRGEVVGVNTAIFSKSGGHNGIGFAIPVNMAESIVERLIEDGKIVRGWLGVFIQDLDEGLAESFGYEGTSGALVGDVPADTPAEAAGILQGDVITHFQGKEVPNVERLRLEVAATRPGSRVELRVFRDGEFENLTVEIGELEGQEFERKTNSRQEERLGLALREMNPELARQMGLDGILGGLAVVQVEPYGVAARAGIEVRDVILAVQGEPAEDLPGFRKLLAKHRGSKGVRLTVQNGNNRRFVFLPATE